MTPTGDSEPDGFRALLDHLKRTRGFDFTGYKRTSLERRIRKRMDELGIADYGDYRDHLEVAPDEFTDLFNTILINVTSFFRDDQAWDYIAQEIVPELIEAVPAEEPIRVWVAGCASGEEAYTIAMILAEALGEEQFKARVKIYATDVDEDALHSARQGIYPSEALEGVPNELADRYFEKGPVGHTFRSDLRRQMIFGRNDLVQDAPISRVDLLISRNTLMYFIADTQAHILSRYNFALNPTGFLFLGRSEMLITHTDLFEPKSMKWRVFTKVPRAGLRDRLAFVTEGGADADRGAPGAELPTSAMDLAPLATVVVNSEGVVTVVNQRAQTVFGIGDGDVGRPFHELELSYRPADLRSALERAYEQRTSVLLDRVSWTPADGPPRTLEIEVSPILGDGSAPLGAMITFADVTLLAELSEDHERSKRQLETAYDELQSTVEELETTNEELHSTNEELETTNEELQSTNQELETMNEELESGNRELETLNTDQATRSEELDRVNLFLEGILGSLGVGVVVLDKEHTVQVWNASSVDLWGLRADEVEGKHFMSLDIGLPVEKLSAAVRAATAEKPETTELSLAATNRRGREIECWVRAEPLRTPSGENYGAILLMADHTQQPGGVPA